MRPDLRHFVERSLAALEREAPNSHARLCASVEGLRLSIKTDGQEFALHFGFRSVRSLPVQDTADVDLAVDRATILALMDGELTLEDALWRDRLELRGSPAHLQQFFDGLLLYVRGGIRCPSFPELISDFRA